MVNESTLCLVFDWVDSIKWDNVQQSCTVGKMVKKICVRYQQEGIDPFLSEKTCIVWLEIVPSGERP